MLGETDDEEHEEAAEGESDEPEGAQESDGESVGDSPATGTPIIASPADGRAVLYRLVELVAPVKPGKERDEFIAKSTDHLFGGQPGLFALGDAKKAAQESLDAQKAAIKVQIANAQNGSDIFDRYLQPGFVPPPSSPAVTTGGGRGDDADAGEGDQSGGGFLGFGEDSYKDVCKALGGIDNLADATKGINVFDAKPTVEARMNAIPVAVAIFYAFHAVCATHARDAAAYYKSMQSVYEAFAKSQGWRIGIHPRGFVCFSKDKSFVKAIGTGGFSYFAFEIETLPPTVRAAADALAKATEG
jgi:hypothetical protein